MIRIIRYNHQSWRNFNRWLEAPQALVVSVCPLLGADDACVPQDPIGPQSVRSLLLMRALAWAVIPTLVPALAPATAAEGAALPPLVLTVAAPMVLLLGSIA